MTPIKLLQGNINVMPLHWSLKCNDGLWNRNKARTESTESPHHDLSDIWVRFSKDGIEYQDIHHEAVWYPDMEKLDGLKDIIFSTMSYVQGESLGGVLITKIPPGKECKPHIDDGWHARHYEKFAVSIASHPSQEFCFENASLVTKPGDLFWFYNQYTHWVTNPSDEARITLIMSIKVGSHITRALKGE